MTEIERLRKKNEGLTKLVVTKTNQLHERDAEIEKLKALITRAIPFVGYEFQVEDLLKELMDAVDFPGREET